MNSRGDVAAAVLRHPLLPTTDARSRDDKRSHAEWYGGRPGFWSMIRATWNGAVLAESDETVKIEGNHYFPLESVHQEYLEDSPTHTRCFWKGTASYYDVVVNGKANPDAAWYYPQPSAAAARTAGRVAFWHGVRVERVRDDGGEIESDRGSILSRLRRRRPAGPPPGSPDLEPVAPVADDTAGDDVMATVTGDNFKLVTAGTFTVIDFWAPWCRPCLQLAPMFDRAAARHGDRLRFGRCDVDENPQLAASLSILSIPTLIMFDPNGQETDRIVGVPGPEQLEALLRLAA